MNVTILAITEIIDKGAVIEFNKDFKRVVASHTAIFREEEKRNVKAAVKRQSASAEEAKPTLGDANEALQALKDKMEGKK